MHEHDDAQLFFRLESLGAFHSELKGDAMITRVQHVHYLNCQNNHDAATRFSRWNTHAQLQIFAAVDHIFEHVIDCVLVNASALSDDLSDIAADTAKKTCGARFGTMTWIVGENAH